MQDQLVDLYRSGIKIAAGITHSALENAVRLQQQQLEVAQRALEATGRSTEQIGEAKNMDDLIAAQSRFAGAQVGRMVEFWSNVWQATSDYQKSMIDQVQSETSELRERMRESASRVAEEASRTVTHAAASTRAAGDEAGHRRSR